MAETKDTLIHEIIWDDGEAQKHVDAWNKNLEQGHSIVDRFTEAFMKMGEHLIEFGINAAKNFATFEASLSHARRTMNAGREDSLALGDKLIALSASFEETGLKAGVSANELARISGVLGQLGFSIQQGEAEFLKLTATVAKVSTAFGMSSVQAAEMLGIMQNLYGLDTSQIENIASAVTVLGNSTVATAGQILNIMQRIGGIAGILGVTAQEAAALAATMREAGISQEVAGTALSQIFSRLSGDVEKFAEVLGKGGLNAELLRTQIESGQATEALISVAQAIKNVEAREGKIAAIQALRDLGLTGVRVQQSLLALSNNLGGLRENLDLSHQAFGENVAVNASYQAAIDNTTGKWAQFQNLLDTITKFIGKELALAFSDFLQNHLIPFTIEFAEWIQSSKGIDAIFGEGGVIAKALDYLGTKLTENQGNLFIWIDNIDKSVEKLVEHLKKMIGKWFKEWDTNVQGMIDDITLLVINLLRITQAFLDLGAAITKVVDSPLIQWMQTLNKFMSFNRGWLLAGVEGIAEDINNLEAVTAETQRMTEASKEYNRGLGEITKSARIMGDVLTGHSVLPDATAATIELTKKTVDYGDAILRTTDTTKYFYQIGQNAWTNLNREVASGTDAWRRSNAAILTDIHDVQFNLYQTGTAVAQLGTRAQQMGNTTTEALQKITGAAPAAIQALNAVAQSAYIAKASISAGLQQQGFNAVSPDVLSSLARSNGVFTTGGLIGLTQIARQNQQPIAQQTGASISQQGALSGQPITIIIDGVETAKLAAVIRAENQGFSRRMSSGFQSGGGF